MQLSANLLAFAASASAFSLLGLPLSLPFGLDESIGHLLNAAPAEPLRLIETAPGTREYRTQEQVLDLIRSGIRFMDITEHPEVDIVDVAKEKHHYPKDIHFYEYVSALNANLSTTFTEDFLTQYTQFWTRYAYSEHGLNASLFLRDKIVELANERSDISVRLFDHDWLQKSIIVRVEGTKHPDDVVVIGAHLDSINYNVTERAPGADDNGSGTSTVLDVFRVLSDSDWRPENTVEFHWYSAEELGLLGALDVFHKYRDDGVKVKAMLQQDCTGYTATSDNNGLPEEVGVVVDYTDRALSSFLELLINTYTGLVFKEFECGYSCSDHAAANRYGYPSAFVIEAGPHRASPFMHTVHDTVDTINFKHIQNHAKFTLGFAVELGAHRF